jgi:hypothetical protein
MMKESWRNRGKIWAVMVGVIVFLAGCASYSGEWYRIPSGAGTRWASYENPLGMKGAGGLENRGAKGHPFDRLGPGESHVLLDVQGSGMITRIWCTVNDRTTETLRGLRIDMYWDGAATPAVSAPFGDFFGATLGRPRAFESALLANPEGKSYNCFIPMPFRKSAKVVVTNETNERLRFLFYDIDYLIGIDHPKDTLYFHTIWRRENPTTLGRDFEILPKVTGRGRFLGCNLGVQCRPENLGWWGEGEVKMYLDGDSAYPTLVGTGTEDYIGTGWGQGEFDHLYQGCLISDKDLGLYTFYRYHVPDPVYFHKDLRVTIQQMGGDAKTSSIEMLDEGVPIQPVTTSWKDDEGQDHFVKLLELDPPVAIEDHPSPDYAWTNYYREDDVCATAYFYLDRPENGLPPLAPFQERVEGLE